eukprot:6211726-Pleurochrysis_carterae.AAC.2
MAPASASSVPFRGRPTPPAQRFGKRRISIIDDDETDVLLRSAATRASSGEALSSTAPPSAVAPETAPPAAAPEAAPPSGEAESSDSDFPSSVPPSPDAPPVSAPPSPPGDDEESRTSRLSAEDRRRILLHVLSTTPLTGVIPSYTAFVASEVWHNSVTLRSYEGPRPGPRPAAAESQEPFPQPEAASSGGPRPVDWTKHMGPGVAVER